VEREAPTLPATVDNRRQEQGTQRRGVNSQRSSRAGLSRPAGDRQAVAITREPGCRLQSGVPSCGGRPPRLAPQWRTHASSTPTHPPRLRRSPRPQDPGPHPGAPLPRPRAHAPRAGGAYVPSNTQSTSRATYGSRVLSNMVSPWAAGGTRSCGLAAETPCSRAQPKGCRWLLPD
jgi:hypothetical protein